LKYVTTLIFAIVIVFAYLLSTTHSKAAYSRFVQVPYEFLTNSEKKEIDCLTDNIYYEAGHEPENGKIAVAYVTLNRVKSKQFHDSVCGVVKQKTGNTCQFSWLCDGSASRKLNYDIYNEVREIALFVYFNHAIIDDPSKGALYYHADYVNPRWKLDKTTVIGRHIFYKPKEAKFNDGKTQY
jgi:spore germination cell wall hydrolase CwlJ-like protein